jgi:ribosome-associated protein
MEEKKGQDILLLDITALESFTDYFVFCNGTSDRHLNALYEDIRESAKKQFEVIPWSQEGNGESEWILMDYGDVVVHLFEAEKRAYYDLEGFWKEGKVLLRIQ